MLNIINPENHKVCSTSKNYDKTMNTIECNCKNNCFETELKYGSTVKEIISINNCLSSYNNIIIYDIKCVIFSYLSCINIYKDIIDYKSYKSRCIFNRLIFSSIKEYGLLNNFRKNKNRQQMIISIVQIYKIMNTHSRYDTSYRVSRIDLIRSNNILAHYHALKLYKLTSNELRYMFNIWRLKRLELCTSQLSNLIYRGLLLFNFDWMHNSFDYIDDNLYDINESMTKNTMYRMCELMYKTQDVSYLYEIIMNNTNDESIKNIVRTFQIPPHIIDKIVDEIKDINDLKHQKYINHKILVDHFDSFTEETLLLIIKRSQYMEFNLIKKIMDKYPILFQYIILNKLISIDNIIKLKEKITSDDWKSIFKNYDIPDNKVCQLSMYLDYKCFLYKRDIKISDQIQMKLKNQLNLLSSEGIN